MKGNILGELLLLKNITKIYQSGDEKLFALKNLSLSIQEGEFVSIMGASGSGKSTLMNIIGALDKPTSGEYILQGISVHSLNDSKLSKLRNNKIGFVFQSFNLLPRYTALQNVELPLIYAQINPSKRKKMAIEALEKVGLNSRMEHYPSQLSGGQQQRVAIARAIVTKPALLLADEPTGALDSDTTVQILSLLDELHNNGSSLILVTHEHDVGEHAERMVIVKDGQIVEDKKNRH